MERTIINKMSFYDIVTLVVPSALVCYAWEMPQIPCSSNWTTYVAQFGVVMMIGFILKGISTWWGSLWFRNNTDIIKREQIRVTNIGGENIGCRFLNIFVFEPFGYIVSPLTHFMYQEDSQLLKNYYDQYATANKDDYCCKRIETLESHVAFLQTWVLAVVIYMFKACNTCTEYWLAIGAGYACILAMLSIQKKIYDLVLESKK